MGKPGFLHSYRYTVTPSAVSVCHYFDGIMSWTPQNADPFQQHFPEVFKWEKWFSVDILQLRCKKNIHIYKNKVLISLGGRGWFWRSNTCSLLDILWLSRSIQLTNRVAQITCHFAVAKLKENSTWNPLVITQSPLIAKGDSLSPGHCQPWAFPNNL